MSGDLESVKDAEPEDYLLPIAALPHHLANGSGRPVVCTSLGSALVTCEWTIIENVLQTLRENGWRVLEQRFPRHAYVVIPYPTP
jgi:hypothetical protein